MIFTFIMGFDCKQPTQKKKAALQKQGDFGGWVEDRA